MFVKGRCYAAIQADEVHLYVNAIDELKGVSHSFEPCFKIVCFALEALTHLSVDV